ncbi:amidohydrolase family protein [Cryobacterium arcticum]|uniref:Amidohydrolase-related domain-containing protein n=1 Tax=Cryobacterium arcticum TaxID=670052 RepID=A0A318A0P1_9MICO|nr:amidohydrolase family protein [Cryobacterium arcticum]PXA73266.1 hypothetical protein CTB96_00460 [Cryobacterium arcticum]
MTRTSVASIRGALVMDAGGGFAPVDRVNVSTGRFSRTSTGGVDLDGSGLWLIPGVYDCHTHLSWNDFHRADRDRRSPAERRALTARALGDTVRGGVVGARDAGGADRALQADVEAGSLLGPRLQISVDMLGPETAGNEDRVRAAVESALDRGAQWIKLIATESIGSPAGAELGSHFSDREFRIAVDLAAARGARVLVHAWGGRAVSAAIDAGVASIEHGIFLTPAQAAQAAAAQLTFVPTLSIYHFVRGLILDGTVPGVPLVRIDEVIIAHRLAVATAHEHGLAIALGSDFATTLQHGTNLTEIGALMRAGLSSAEALTAATRTGAALLGIRDGGVIADDYLADAVLLSSDPTDPATFESPGSVAAVMMGGTLVPLEPGTSPHRTPQQQ